MKAAMILCLFLSQLVGLASCAAPLSQQHHEAQQPPAKKERPKSEWHAATYRGLTIGKSTRADMLRVFGKPQWSGPPGDQMEGDPDPEVWYDYEGVAEFTGKLTVIVDERSNVILGIDLYPENLSKEEAIKHFGDDYVITRYDFDICLGNEESAPLYESPNGEIKIIEYRERGIAIGFNYQDKVEHIQYVSKPIGATSSKCKDEDK